LVSELPAAPEDTVKSEEQRDSQKSATGKAMWSVTAPVSVVAVRAEVRAVKTVRVPERPEDKAEDQRDCDEDDDAWDDNKGEHGALSIQDAVKSCPTHRSRDLRCAE